jgi:hypothetical protein
MTAHLPITFHQAMSLAVDEVEDQYPGSDVRLARQALQLADNPAQIDALADLVAAGVEHLRWQTEDEVGSVLPWFSDNPAQDVRAWFYGAEETA